MSKFFKKLVTPIPLTIIICLIFVVFYTLKGVYGNIKYNDILTTIDRKIADYILKYRDVQPISDKIALIAVDGFSVKELGRWPWSRRIIKEIITTLNTHYNVSVIGFDIVFSEADQTYIAVKESLDSIPEDQLDSNLRSEILINRDYDSKLAAEFDKWDNIVSGYFFRNDLEESGLSDEELKMRLDVISHMKIPTLIFHNQKPVVDQIHKAQFPEINIFSEKLENNFNSGFFSITPDPDDGVVRRVESIYDVNGSYYPSLALEMYKKYLTVHDPDFYADYSIEFDDSGFATSINVGEQRFSVDSEATFLINFRGPENTIKHYSFIDVLRKNIDKEELEGKLVFLGVTELGVYDIRSTPVGAEYPGLEVQGTILENLISDNFLINNNFTQIISIFEIILGCFLLLFIKKIRKDLYGDLAIFLIAIALVWVNIFLFNTNNYIISYAFPLSAMILSWVAVTLHNVVTEGQDKRFIKSAFSQYLAPKVIDQLINDPSQLKLGGRRKELTLMFTDLQGFSAISEKLDVHQLTTILNDYLTKMVNIIMKHEGTVDKFEGDAIIAFWGAPIDSDKHQENACRAIIEMQETMVEFRKSQEKNNSPPFIMRVGVNTGEVMVGNFGSEQRMDYTIIGDAANLAARLEGVNKVYGTQSIISENTYKAVADLFEARMLDEVMVVGKDIPIKIYELLCFKGKLSDKHKWRNETYKKAFETYRNQQFQLAKQQFQSIIDKFPDDIASKTFKRRIEEYLINPPDKNWDGTFRLVNK